MKDKKTKTTVCLDSIIKSAEEYEKKLQKVLKKDPALFKVLYDLVNSGYPEEAMHSMERFLKAKKQ